MHTCAYLHTRHYTYWHNKQFWHYNLSLLQVYEHCWSVLVDQVTGMRYLGLLCGQRYYTVHLLKLRTFLQESSSDSPMSPCNTLLTAGVTIADTTCTCTCMHTLIMRACTSTGYVHRYITVTGYMCMYISLESITVFIYIVDYWWLFTSTSSIKGGPIKLCSWIQLQLTSFTTRRWGKDGELGGKGGWCY